MGRPIGIDLGTTNTVLAAIVAGRAVVIPNREGGLLTPSLVAVGEDGEPVVGSQAPLAVASGSSRLVRSIKRLMGSDTVLSFGARQLSPEEISSFILRKVVSDAEAYLGERIEQVVITVPAYFNDRQRQATRRAGELAGLQVQRIISEPTAAALAYGLDREDAHTILVWDLGGGTFDVSIVEIGEGIVEVRAVSGDSWLGGDDVDERVAALLAHEVGRRMGRPPDLDAPLRACLRTLAEQAKIRLSMVEETVVQLPAELGPALAITLTRRQLERLTADLLARMAEVTHQALRDAGLRPEEIERVVLVGGATRMPAVRALAREVLGKEPYCYLDPDTVVAQGAAIQAGVLSGTIGQAVLLDVLPLSLGVETQGGLTTTIIPRNTPLPAVGSRLFTTARDGQTTMDIHVVQGERALAADNVSLGRLTLSGIPSAPRGLPRVEVAFTADVDGIIHVTATDLLSETAVEARIVAIKTLDASMIESILAKAEQSVASDRAQRERIEALIQANHAIDAATMMLTGMDGTLSMEARRRVVQLREQLREARDIGVVDLMRFYSSELREAICEIAGSSSNR